MKKHFKVFINFKQTTTYSILSDELHGYTSRPIGGHLEDNKIYKVKLILHLYFLLRLRSDVLHFQNISGNKNIKINKIFK
jgi:hypothetical protein